jgi:hypothetical protein
MARPLFVIKSFLALLEVLWMLMKVYQDPFYCREITVL